MSPALDIPGLEAAVALLEERFHPAAVLLYGSAAKGTLGPESDLDLALVFGDVAGASRPDALVLYDVRADVEGLVRRDVDLVVLDTASPILRMEVFRHHRVLAAGAPRAIDRLLARTLIEYADLKVVRRPIERAILQGTRR